MKSQSYEAAKQSQVIQIFDSWLSNTNISSHAGKDYATAPCSLLPQQDNTLPSPPPIATHNLSEPQQPQRNIEEEETPVIAVYEAAPSPPGANIPQQQHSTVTSPVSNTEYIFEQTEDDLLTTSSPRTEIHNTIPPEIPSSPATSPELENGVDLITISSDVSLSQRHDALETTQESPTFIPDTTDSCPQHPGSSTLELPCSSGHSMITRSRHGIVKPNIKYALTTSISRDIPHYKSGFETLYSVLSLFFFKTQAWWREQLHHLGFHPVRQWFNHSRGSLFSDMAQYFIEGKNGCPVLRRYNVPLVFASAWKPELVQSDGGSDNKENVGNPESISSCLELNDRSIIQNECEEEGDPTIMREGNVWSPECPSINEIAASSEIFDILESVCHVYKLPLALTWISDGRETAKNSEGKNLLRVEETACYVNDLGASEFVAICAGFDLEERQGVAGKALLSNIYFVPDVSELGPADYPFVYEAWKFGLHGAVAIKLRSTYRSSVDYILEFFLPSKMREISEKQLLVNKILSTLQKNCRNSWIVCGIDLNVADAVSEVTAAEMSGITLMPKSDNSPSASNVD
ncbi:hypothetical protein DKX38_011988 [Salix brachista]|uniref:NLP1-9 GAF domain-containing protein n=1 Tax=Salix brachista TaxID=2182728 RepID=A0A5N5M0Q3_9ROSI|nr:hypothetical protein DKX38_011988 [Salix brachista]